MTVHPYWDKLQHSNRIDFDLQNGLEEWFDWTSCLKLGGETSVADGVPYSPMPDWNRRYVAASILQHSRDWTWSLKRYICLLGLQNWGPRVQVDGPDVTLPWIQYRGRGKTHFAFFTAQISHGMAWLSTFGKLLAGKLESRPVQSNVHKSERVLKKNVWCPSYRSTAGTNADLIK
jgi:hypothetical protein